MTPNNNQRFPVDDEQQENNFVNAGEYEDIVFEEQDKFAEKLNDYFERSNESHWEGRLEDE